MSFTKYKDYFFSILPGFLVCFAISIISKFLEKYAPTLGAATIAIILGLILGNTILKQKIFNKGTKFSEGTLLSISVVLLGGTLSFNTIMTLGIKGILYIILQMTITISFVIYLGNKMNFSKDFTYLMASGNGVCGSSAIASVTPAINANDKDKGIAITLVNITGTCLMLLLPIVSYVMFNMDSYKTSALLGGVLQSVGQVVASGKMISPEVTDLATIFKIVRIIFIIFVVIYLSYLKNKNSIDNKSNPLVDKTKKKLKIKVPWYVIGFFIGCGLFTIGIIPTSLSHTFKVISSNFEIIALAGIGMRVKLIDLISNGTRFTGYAALIGLVQTISAVILISIIL